MNKYPQLDLARGLAALLVFFNHLRYLIFRGYHDQEMGILGKLFFFITGFGHQSVMVFFVLSGFFIAKSIIESLERGDWNVKRYAVQRLTRLWVVLIPALMLTYVADYIACNYFRFYDCPLDSSSLVNFLQNVFFLQNVTGPTFGSNLALWSLGNEFWYYVLLPFILLPVYMPKNRKRMIAIAVIALVAGIWLLSHLFVGVAGLLIFLMGSLVYLLTRKLQAALSKNWCRACLVIFVTELTLSRFYPSPAVLWDIVQGTTFAVLAYAWLGSPNTLSERYVRPSRFVSRFSYTLYIVHIPLMLLFCAIFQLNDALFSLHVMKYYFLLTAIILPLCWLFYWLFERNTWQIRHYLECRLL